MYLELSKKQRRIYKKRISYQADSLERMFENDNDNGDYIKRMLTSIENFITEPDELKLAEHINSCQAVANRLFHISLSGNGHAREVIVINTLKKGAFPLMTWNPKQRKEDGKNVNELIEVKTANRSTMHYTKEWYPKGCGELDFTFNNKTYHRKQFDLSVFGVFYEELLQYIIVPTNMIIIHDYLTDMNEKYEKIAKQKGKNESSTLLKIRHKTLFCILGDNYFIVNKDGDKFNNLDEFETAQRLKAKIVDITNFVK